MDLWKHARLITLELQTTHWLLFDSQSSSYVVSYIGVCEGGDWKCVFCPQLEKVLQQGDIGECAEPYMVFKESDAAKVWSHTATPSYPLHHT